MVQSVFNRLTGNRTLERQQIGSQLQIHVVIRGVAIQAIANDRETGLREVATHLVFATGRNAHIHQRPAIFDTHKRNFAGCLLVLDRCLDSQRIRLCRKVTGHPSSIAFLNLPVSKQGRQRGGNRSGMRNQDQAVRGAIQAMHNECRPFRQQVPFGPTGDRTVVAPLRALRTQAVGLVPDRITTDVGNELWLGRYFGKHAWIVVKVELIARAEFAFRTPQPLRVLAAGQPDRAFGHRRLELTFREPARAMQQVNRIPGGRLDDDVFFYAICRAFHPLILTLHPARRIATHEVEYLGLADPVEVALDRMLQAARCDREFQ